MVYLKIERVFIVSIRQDIDKGFRFPKTQELQLTLEDLLEDKVDNKYFVKKDFFNIDLPYKCKARQTAIVTNNGKNINRFTSIACCIAARDWKGFGKQSMNGVIETQEDNLRIRRLTPKEYFRLMGFEDIDIDILINNRISNTQLYKMAGNSIVVNVVYYLFKELKGIYPDLFFITKKDVNQVSIDEVLEEAYYE